jgi:hypothetical protein
MNRQLGKLGLLAFLLITFGLGLAMRWELLTGWLTGHGFSYAAVRHAHSHAGYYGVLVLPWLWALQREKCQIPNALIYAYAVIALATSLFFIPFGYNALTIALSTLVLAGWLSAAVFAFRHRTNPASWLAPTPWAIMIAAAIIPPIAVLDSRNPALSAALAHLFLGVLLLGVFVPTAFSLTRLRRRRSTMLYLVSACLAAGVFAFRDAFGLAAPALLAVYAWWVWDATKEARPHLRILWGALSLGLILEGFLPAFQTYAVRIAGIHFAILGPVLVSFAMALGIRTNRTLGTLYAASLGAMLASIAWGPLLFGASAMLWTAVASTSYVLAACAVVIRHWSQLDSPPRPVTDVLEFSD